MIWNDPTWAPVLENVFHIILAWVLAIPVALDRERNTKIMGLRTFPLVAMGTCAYIRVALDFIGEAPDPKARLIQGLVTGVSFIGAGAIIKDDRNGAVRGTASAASIWAVVALAAAVAFEVYEVAVLLAVANFFTLRLLGNAKDDVDDTGAA